MGDPFEYRKGQRVIHVDMGEVTITEVHDGMVVVADEFHDTVTVSTAEIN